MVPEGYGKLPDGIRCRCLNMWQEGGDFYCCKPDKMPPAVNQATDLDDVLSEARSYMSLGATSAQYAAGQVVQGLVRTDGDIRVLRSYLDNARRQIADAQEQLLHAMVKLNDAEKMKRASANSK